MHRPARRARRRPPDQQRAESDQHDALAPPGGRSAQRHREQRKHGQQIAGGDVRTLHRFPVSIGRGTLLRHPSRSPPRGATVGMRRRRGSPHVGLIRSLTRARLGAKPGIRLPGRIFRCESARVGDVPRRPTNDGGGFTLRSPHRRPDGQARAPAPSFLAGDPGEICRSASQTQSSRTPQATAPDPKNESARRPTGGSNGHGATRLHRNRLASNGLYRNARLALASWPGGCLKREGQIRPSDQGSSRDPATPESAWPCRRFAST